MNKLVEQSVQTDRQFEEQEGQTDEKIGGTGQFVGRVLQTDRQKAEQTDSWAKKETDRWNRSFHRWKFADSSDKWTAR